MDFERRALYRMYSLYACMPCFSLQAVLFKVCNASRLSLFTKVVKCQQGVNFTVTGILKNRRACFYADYSNSSSPIRLQGEQGPTGCVVGPTFSLPHWKRVQSPHKISVLWLTHGGTPLGTMNSDSISIHLFAVGTKSLLTKSVST